jgi:hypothetical protein
MSCSEEIQKNLAEFLRECHVRGIEVHALQGNPLWALKQHHPQVVAWVKGYLDFNQSRPKEERMGGVHLDIEPYLTSDWETGDRDKLKSEFVELLQALRQTIDAQRGESPFLLGLAIPVFYDREADFEEKLLREVDYIALMDYYDSGIDIVEHSGFHIDAANRLEKKVFIGVETQDLVRMGQGKRRNTFHEEGWEEMERQLAMVAEHLGGAPSFAGIAIHAYDSYRLLQKGRNVPTRERSSRVPPITAPAVTGPIAVDGDLGDWDGAAWIAMDQRPDVVYGAGAWKGPQDASFKTAIRWEPKALLLALEVTDNALLQEKKGPDMWEGDHAEIWIDADLLGDYSEAVNSADDFQIGLSPGNFAGLAPEVHVWVPSVDPKSISQLEIAAQKKPSGYTLEVRIPAKFLFQTAGKRVGVEPIGYSPQIPRRISPQINALQNGVLNSSSLKSGFRLGIMVDVSDADNPQQPQKAMLSTSPERQWGDPTTFNILELE